MTDKNDEHRKHLISSLPAILTGSAALIAALTTTYVNLHNNDKDKSAPAAAAPVAAAAPTSPAKPPEPTGPQRLHLHVERIVVHSDGTAGTTDWRFSVEVADEPRFAFDQDGLTDEGGRNFAIPDSDGTEVTVTPEHPLKLVVKGWKRSVLHASSPVPDAIGEGRILPDGKIEPVPVNAATPDAGAFTFHFAAEPASVSAAEAGKAP